MIPPTVPIHFPHKSLINLTDKQLRGASCQLYQLPKICPFPLTISNIPNFALGKRIKHYGQKINVLFRQILNGYVWHDYDDCRVRSLKLLEAFFGNCFSRSLGIFLQDGYGEELNGWNQRMANGAEKWNFKMKKDLPTNTIFRQSSTHQHTQFTHQHIHQHL